jgi:cell volume regulation protein A
MFVTLGLLVFPSHIVPLMSSGLLLTFLLMVVARPVSVFLCLAPFKVSLSRKTLLSWVGLRGAVPIILATFPFMAGIPQAGTIFNIVFFVVFTSVLIQGTSIPIVSKLLKLDAPLLNRINYPIEFERTGAMDAELTDIIVPYNSEIVGKRIRELGIPEKCLIVLISREGKFVIPSGGTVVESGDVLLVLANTEDFALLQRIVGQLSKS